MSRKSLTTGTVAKWLYKLQIWELGTIWRLGSIEADLKSQLAKATSGKTPITIVQDIMGKHHTAIEKQIENAIPHTSVPMASMASTEGGAAGVFGIEPQDWSAFFNQIRTLNTDQQKEMMTYLRQKVWSQTATKNLNAMPDQFAAAYQHNLTELAKEAGKTDPRFSDALLDPYSNEMIDVKTLIEYHAAAKTLGLPFEYYESLVERCDDAIKKINERKETISRDISTLENKSLSPLSRAQNHLQGLQDMQKSLEKKIASLNEAREEFQQSWKHEDNSLKQYNPQNESDQKEIDKITKKATSFETLIRTNALPRPLISNAAALTQFPSMMSQFYKDSPMHATVYNNLQAKTKDYSEARDRLEQTRFLKEVATGGEHEKTFKDNYDAQLKHIHKLSQEIASLLEGNQKLFEADALNADVHDRTTRRNVALAALYDYTTHLAHAQQVVAQELGSSIEETPIPILGGDDDMLDVKNTQAATTNQLFDAFNAPCVITKIDYVTNLDTGKKERRESTVQGGSLTHGEERAAVAAWNSGVGEANCKKHGIEYHPIEIKEHWFDSGFQEKCSSKENRDAFNNWKVEHENALTKKQGSQLGGPESTTVIERPIKPASANGSITDPSGGVTVPITPREPQQQQTVFTPGS